jgi:hypothetical protein
MSLGVETMRTDNDNKGDSKRTIDEDRQETWRVYLRRALP